MKQKKLLLLNGSPRKKGTSYSFARTLGILAEKMGHEVKIVHLYDYFDGKEDLNALAGLLRKMDYIGLIAPLYVDTLPYPNIWLLEELKNKNEVEPQLLKGKGFFTIGQFGFPDITRAEPLINACKFFAEECTMNWLGGLAYGGGAIINGTHLEDLGKKGEKMSQEFQMLLDAIMNDQPIPSNLQELFRLKIPKFLFLPLAIFLNKNSRKEAKKYGVKDLKAKVY